MRSSIPETKGGSKDAAPCASQLMVWPARTVAVEASIAEALGFMERALINAAPVVSRGQVVGILTRRIAAGGVAHGLGQHPARDFMLDPCLVAPEEGLEELARLVATRKLRLIPVVDSREGADGLVGVITRTAILNALAGGSPMTERSRLTLEGLAPRLLAILVKASRLAAEESVALAAVGGVVRDLLLGAPTEDLDLMVEGHETAIDRFLNRLTAGLEAKPQSHARFGTVVLELPDGLKLDVAMARLEYYAHPAALPQVEPGSLWLDLRRRDFTINSLAVRIDGDHLGQLMDPFGGRRDLERGQINVLHGLSFIDDPTRIFRAIRFEQRFQFSLGMETQRLLQSAVTLGVVERLSNDRLSAELAQILKEPRFVESVRRLAELGLMGCFRLLPPTRAQLEALSRTQAAWELLEQAAVLHPFQGGVPSVVLLRVSVLLAGLEGPLRSSAAARLALRGATLARVRDACVLRSTLLQTLTNADLDTPSSLTRLLEPCAPETLALLHSWTEDGVVRARLQHYLLHCRPVRAPIGGHELKALGITPGPLFRVLLSHLRDMALDRGLTRPQAVDYVRGLSSSDLESLQARLERLDARIEAQLKSGLDAGFDGQSQPA